MALLLLGVGASPVGARQSGQNSWAVTGATLIDGTGATPVESTVIVGQDDRIVCAGRAAECAVPAGARVLEAAGKWIIPGLIDTHVHLGWRADGSSDRAQLIRLAFGTTTVREAGTPGSLERNLARREAAGRPVSAEPRLVVSALVSQEHIERYGPHDLAAVVRRLAELGADAIKLKQTFTAGELQTIIDAAHGLGRPVFGHTWRRNGSDLAPALTASIDGLSHMFTFSEYGERANANRPPAPAGLAFWVWTKEQWNFQDDARLVEITGRIIEQGVWIEPMLVTEKHFTLPYPLPDDVAYLDEIPSLEQLVRRSLPVGDTGWVRRPARRARLAVVYDRMCEFVRQFHARGGMVVTGTDDMLPGPGLLEEIRLLTGCGLTPMAALQAATLHAAAALKRSDLGTIEAGKRADLVILDADPISDPNNLRRIWRVVKGGYVHDPSLLLESERSSYVTRVRWAWAARFGAGLGVLGLPAALVAARRQWHSRRQRRSGSAS